MSSKETSGLFLTIALFLLVTAALIFGAIAEDVVTREPLTLLDARFSVWLEVHRVGWLTRCLLLVTRLHSSLGVTVTTFAVCGYLWVKGLRLWVLRFLLAVFGGMGLNFLLKHLFVRARPRFQTPLLTLSSYSFPSGHTLMATVFYGALCALLLSRAGKWGWGRRAPIVVATGFAVLTVGFSRIYLGAHYLSDVLAAIAEGVAWLAFSLIVVEEVKRRLKWDQQN